MMMWNRLRYTVWAPAYDALVRAAGFDAARRLSSDGLRLAPNGRDKLNAVGQYTKSFLGQLVHGG
jgi:hypothetical protein